MDPTTTDGVIYLPIDGGDIRLCLQDEERQPLPLKSYRGGLGVTRIVRPDFSNHLPNGLFFVLHHSFPYTTIQVQILAEWGEASNQGIIGTVELPPGLDVIIGHRFDFQTLRETPFVLQPHQHGVVLALGKNLLIKSIHVQYRASDTGCWMRAFTIHFNDRHS